MCSRDDEVTTRHCPNCGETYYGDLGHRGCPAAIRKPVESPFKPEPEPQKSGDKKELSDVPP